MLVLFIDVLLQFPGICRYKQYCHRDVYCNTVMSFGFSSIVYLGSTIYTEIEREREREEEEEEEEKERERTEKRKTEKKETKIQK